MVFDNRLSLGTFNLLYRENGLFSLYRSLHTILTLHKLRGKHVVHAFHFHTIDNQLTLISIIL